MPIGFQTMSHGEIPIGFFNIESDIFLINNYFIFASELSKAIQNWTKGEDELEMDLKMYIIEDNKNIGNLMGAINGVIFTGFIGELYKLFPFPAKPEDFKQKTGGYKTQKEVDAIIQKYAKLEPVKVIISRDENAITIGEYEFKKEQFHEVIAYIWRGGMPMWKDDIRPDYVEEMMKAVLNSNHWFFQGAVEIGEF